MGVRWANKLNGNVFMDDRKPLVLYSKCIRQNCHKKLNENDKALKLKSENT